MSYSVEAQFKARLSVSSAAVGGSWQDGKVKDYLVLSELLELCVPIDAGLDLGHLGTLFVASGGGWRKGEDCGRFTLGDLAEFGALCQQLQRKYRPHEFKTQAQGYFTLRLWEHLKSKEGEAGMCEWLTALLLNNASVAAETELHRSAQPSRLHGKSEQQQTGETLPYTPSSATQGIPTEVQSAGKQGASREEEENVVSKRASNDSSDKSESKPLKQSPDQIESRPDREVAREASSHSSLVTLEDDDDEEEQDEDGDDDLSEAHLAGLRMIVEQPGKFIDVSSAEIMHKLFNVKECDAMTFQQFLDMLQQVGEELGDSDLSDERQDEVVPVAVVQRFASRFVRGLRDLMLDVLTPSC